MSGNVRNVGQRHSTIHRSTMAKVIIQPIAPPMSEPRMTYHIGDLAKKATTVFLEVAKITL
jgi:hypothetical protein